MNVTKDPIITITVQATEKELQELDSQLSDIYEELIKAKINPSGFDKVWELKDSLTLETL